MKKQLRICVSDTAQPINSQSSVGVLVRINWPRAIYYNSERIKAHLFNVREKREMPM
jgi:hypothetical protein